LRRFLLSIPLLKDPFRANNKLFKCEDIPYKTADDVAWDHIKIMKAMQQARDLLDTDKFGEVTSLGFEHQLKGVDKYHFRVSVTKLYETEDEAQKAGKKLMPSELLVDIPEVGVVSVPIIALERGPFTIYGDIENGSRIQTEGVRFKGVISHMKYLDVGRGVSCAHILTNLDGNGKGATPDYSAGYIVAGEILVHLYDKTYNFAEDEKKRRNMYDFAWCDLPNASDNCYKVYDDDGSQVTLQASRDVLEKGEPIALWNRELGILKGTIANVMSGCFFEIDDKKMFMEYGFEIDLGQDAAFVQVGACGTLVWSTRDFRVLGMIGGSGSDDDRVYVNRVPDESMIEHCESR